MSKVNPYEYLNVPSGWTCKRLEECTQDRNISYGIVQPGQHTESGVPVIRVNNVNNGQLELKDVLKVSNEIEKKYERTRLKGGEILLTLVGSTGQSFVAPKELAGWNVPRAIAVIRVDESIGANWINICLQTEEVKHFLNVRANTTVQKTLNLKDVRDIPILIPPKDVNTSIENIALGLSQKIRLNTQTNQTLESIAQAIFKSWFVDFEPVKAKMAAKERWYAMQPTSESASPVCYADEAALPDLETYTNLAAMRAISGKNETELTQLQQQNPDQYQQLAETAALFPSAMVDSELGEIPEGWKAKNIESILGLAYGKSLGKTDRVDGDVPVYGSGGLTGWHNKSLVDGPGIIVGRKGTVGSIYWEKKSFFPIDTVFYVVPKDGIPLIYTYYLLQTLGLESMNTDAAVPGLNRNNVYRLDTVYSSTELIKAFSKLADSLRKTFDSLIEQSDQLIQIRDSLLPKLLSGEISLENYNESKLNHI